MKTALFKTRRKAIDQIRESESLEDRMDQMLFDNRPIHPVELECLTGGRSDCAACPRGDCRSRKGEKSATA